MYVSVCVLKGAVSILKL